jgi:chromate reductase
MHIKKNVLAISGSTRTRSSNLNLIKAIQQLSANSFSVRVFDGLMGIPPFNPDDDNENPPAAIVSLRQQINDADGVLICTPEYAMGVPGTLKNLLDWTVSSMEFSNKPVALITASSSGQKGHISLLETLKVIETKMTEGTQLLISFIKAKVADDCIITDKTTLEQVQQLIVSFSGLMNEG